MTLGNLAVVVICAFALTIAPDIGFAAQNGGGGGGGSGGGGGGGGKGGGGNSSGGGRGQADVKICKKGYSYDRKARKCLAKHSIPDSELIKQVWRTG